MGAFVATLGALTACSAPSSNTTAALANCSAPSGAAPSGAAPSGAAGDAAADRVQVCAAEPLLATTDASAGSVAGASRETSAPDASTASPTADTTSIDSTPTPADSRNAPLPDASDPLRVSAHATSAHAPTAASATPETAAPIAGPSKPFVQRSSDAVAAMSVPGAPAPLSRFDTFLTRLVELTNQQRVAAGVTPAGRSVELTASAVAHSDDQAIHKTMGHIGSDGSTLADRVNLSGFRWSELGENVAVGYATADDVMTGWLASPNHRSNILKPEFTHVGVAVAAADDGTLYWTMDLGTAG